jgi:transposase
MNGRIEVISGPERRRRWSHEEKLRLVVDACRPGNSVSQIARQRGISASQLFGWRRQMLAKGLITDNRSEARVAPALTFAPVEVKEEPAARDGARKARPTRRGKGMGPSGLIEIELKGGDRVRIEGCADIGLVERIVATLRC